MHQLASLALHFTPIYLPLYQNPNEPISLDIDNHRLIQDFTTSIIVSIRVIMNLEVQAERVANMDPPIQTAPSDQHLCYVRCNFCNTLLAVGIPYKRLLDTVTVKCGHCSNLSFLTIRPSPPDHLLQPPPLPPFQSAFSGDLKRGQSSSSSSSTSNEPTSPKAPFVVKPPEKKHRLPSAYNRFMKEEIQRIKASNPQIPHREAFSTAAKNWAGHIPNGSISGSINTGFDLSGLK